MRKIFMAMAVLFNCTLIMAQTEFDALRYVQPDINGTARYMGMAGAFGALGSDASAIKDNPAGLGIYRHSEVVATANLLMQSTTAEWNMATGKDKLFKPGLNNFSAIYTLLLKKGEEETKGFLNANFSLSYNRLKNFNRSLNIKSEIGSSKSSITDYIADYTGGDISNTDLTSNDPYTSATIPWISILAYDGGLISGYDNNGTTSWSSNLGNSETVTPSYNLTEKGFIDEYSIGFAGNYSNFVYFGAGVNIKSINYAAYSKYSEIFAIGAGEGGGMDLMDTISTKGTGLNFNIGAIVRPLKFLQVGLSFQTPSVFKLENNYNSGLNYNFTEQGSVQTPGGMNSYQLKSPMQLNASAAFILENKGILSLEYNYRNSTATQLKDENGVSDSYGDENLRMKDVLKDIQTIKVGVEYNLSENFAIRAGYAISSTANNPDSIKTEPAKISRYNMRTDTEYFFQKSTNYITAGFGYHKAKWVVDFAYMNKSTEQTYFPYNSNTLALKAESAKVIINNNNLVLTFGYKF